MPLCWEDGRGGGGGARCPVDLSIYGQIAGLDEEGVRMPPHELDGRVGGGRGLSQH